MSQQNVALEYHNFLQGGATKCGPRAQSPMRPHEVLRQFRLYQAPRAHIKADANLEPGHGKGSPREISAHEFWSRNVTYRKGRPRSARVQNCNFFSLWSPGMKNKCTRKAEQNLYTYCAEKNNKSIRIFCIQVYGKSSSKSVHLFDQESGRISVHKKTQGKLYTYV